MHEKNYGLISVPQLKKTFWLFFMQSPVLWCEKVLVSIPSPNWRKHFDFFSTNSCLYFYKLFLATSKSHVGMTGHQKTYFVSKRMWRIKSWNFFLTAQQACQDGHFDYFPQIPVVSKWKNSGFNSIPQLKKTFWLFFRKIPVIISTSMHEKIPCSFPSPNWRKPFDCFSANSCLYFFKLFLATSKCHVGMTGHQKQILYVKGCEEE